MAEQNQPEREPTLGTMMRDAISELEAENARLQEQYEGVVRERDHFSRQADAMFGQKVEAETERDRLKEQLETLKAERDEGRRGSHQRQEWERRARDAEEQLDAATSERDRLLYGYRQIVGATEGAKPLFDQKARRYAQAVLDGFTSNPAMSQEVE